MVSSETPVDGDFCSWVETSAVVCVSVKVGAAAGSSGVDGVVMDVKAGSVETVGVLMVVSAAVVEVEVMLTSSVGGGAAAAVFSSADVVAGLGGAADVSGDFSGSDVIGARGETDWIRTEVTV